MKTSGALGPSVWVASDGRAGNAAQVLAIARALGEMYRWVKIAHINGEGHRSAPIELTPKGLQPLLPSSMWWSPLGALPPRKIRSLSVNLLLSLKLQESSR